MSKSFIRISIITFFIFISIPTASGSEMEEIENISGRNFLAIQSAVAELKKNNLRVINYTISVWAKDSSLVVAFQDPNHPENVFGSSGANPGFAVELTKDDATIIRSYFMK